MRRAAWFIATFTDAYRVARDATADTPRIVSGRGGSAREHTRPAAVNSNRSPLLVDKEVGCDEGDYEETHQYSKRRDSQDAGFPSTGFRQGLGNSGERHPDDHKQIRVEQCRPFYNDVVPLLAGQQECATEEDQSKGRQRAR